MVDVLFHVWVFSLVSGWCSDGFRLLFGSPRLGLWRPKLGLGRLGLGLVLGSPIATLKDTEAGQHRTEAGWDSHGRASCSGGLFCTSWSIHVIREHPEALSQHYH